MPPTTIRSAPAPDSFTSLEDHQSQTPISFYAAKPVLHHHISGVSVLIARDQKPNLPIFQPANAAIHEGTTSTDSNHQAEGDVVDIYVSSEDFILFNTSTSIGVSIPYPSIALHAVQRLPSPSPPIEPHTTAPFGLLMNIELESPPSNDDVEDEEAPDVLELTLIPPSRENDSASHDAVQALFAAISTCSNLHPDPISQGDDEEMDDGGGADRIMFEGSVGYEGFSGLPGVARGASDGGLPPPFPGSGEWITAENVGEYFDEEGNWRGGGEGPEEAGVLGEGAGRVRGREEEIGEVVEVNGHREDEDEDHKRQRME